MKILKFLANADVFMTEDFYFYKAKVPVLLNDADNLQKEGRKLLIQKIAPRYKNSFVEIYVIERALFSPYYFAVALSADGGRTLCSDVFTKALFPYKIQMMGKADFAVAWLGETQKVITDDGICFEDVQNGFGENWSVFMLAEDKSFRNISEDLGATGDVHISSLRYDDGILNISLMTQGGAYEDKNLLFMKQGNGYCRISREENEIYWADVYNRVVESSEWMPADGALLNNLYEFAGVI